VRRNFVAGNWKMNTSLAEAVALARAVADGSAGTAVDLAVAPPYVYLAAVADAVKGSGVAVSAQNMYFEAKGAFTGEVSAQMLLDVGCSYVILGHSERRHVMGESDELINRKVKAALAAGLNPILCIGELLEEREAGRTSAVCERHVTVWAIGTGRTATPEQAQEVHAEVRALIGKLYGPDVAGALRIQYGGSVKPENAAALMSQPDVDGALVGGASLKADSFLAIAKAAS